MALSPGTSIGAYRIESAIGAGGMGEVYRATDTRLNRPVALKFLLRSLEGEDARHRFQREVSALSALNHPHIVTVHEAGTFDGRDFLVTEYVDGGTLTTWARAEKRNWRQVVELLVGVADALATAHDAGILHRDIKPDNILVARSGYAKLADFGLAKRTGLNAADTRTVSGSPTRLGAIVGTIEYLSPEQARGAVLDARSDIFSFGIVLYEVLSGRRPFTGSTDLHVVEAVLHETPPSLGEEIPPELRGVVEKALEKDPSDRYQSMRELVVDLRRLARHTGTTSAVVRQPLRPRSLRIAVGVSVVALIAAAALWLYRPGQGSAAVDAPQIRSIAVLPLQNLSADPNEEYFSDGMTEQLISSLAQVHALRVISRTSVMQYKATTKKLSDIGRELGVDAIIEGSVRRVGGRVRVTAQLIRAASDAHLWARDFDHDFSDVLMLQAEVADAIVREIKVQVTPDESGRLTASRPVDPKAYELFMLGRYHYWQRTPEAWKQSVEELEQAVRLQPDYAPAHAALSMAWSSGRDLAFTRSEGAMREAAQKAVELDPSLAEGHAALAGIAFEDWDWNGTLAEYEKALALNPESIDVCGCYGNVLAAFGRFDEAVRVVERGIRANPLSIDLRNNYAFVLYTARRYSDAERELKQAIELDPRDVFAYIFLASVYIETGRVPEALKVADRPELQASPALGRAFAELGRRDEALKVLSRMDANADPNSVAIVHFALGNDDEGFRLLTKSVDERQGFARWINVAPYFDRVRTDPRFVALVARMKLPDSLTSH